MARDTSPMALSRRWVVALDPPPTDDALPCIVITRICLRDAEKTKFSDTNIEITYVKGVYTGQNIRIV